MLYNTSVIDRDTLLAYIQRTLGIQSHDIELSPEQYQDVIDDVMQEFLEFCYDGHENIYMVLSVTAGTLIYTLPDDMLSVTKVFMGTSIDSIRMRAFYDKATADLIYSSTNPYTYLDYSLTQMFLNDCNDLVIPPVQFNFNSMTKKLKIFDVNETKQVMVKGVKYAGESSVDFENLYNHRWIKARCVAVAYDRWYQNLIKYDGDLYDGKIKLNLDRISKKAEDKLKETKEDLTTTYSDSFGIMNF